MSLVQQHTTTKRQDRQMNKTTALKNQIEYFELELVFAKHCVTRGIAVAINEKQIRELTNKIADLQCELALTK